MNVITHLLSGWAVAEPTTLEHRDRSILAWACAAPDLDGLGVVVDTANRALGRPETFFYSQWHHELLHGLPGAVAIAAISALAARSRFRVAALSFALVHLHLLCDFEGSRGPSPTDIWPIHYRRPMLHQGQSSDLVQTALLKIMELRRRRVRVHRADESGH